MQSKDYIFTTDKIKFPIFQDQNFNELINQQLTDKVFFSDFDALAELINNFLTAYIETIITNKHDINTYCQKYNKKSTKYVLHAKLLLKLSNFIKGKFQSQNEKINLGALSINDVIVDVSSSDSVKTLIQQQYQGSPIDSDQGIKNIYSYLERVSSTPALPGKVILNIGVKYSIFLFDNITKLLKQFNSIKNFKDKNELQNNEIIFFNLILQLDKVANLALILHNSYLSDPKDIFNLPEEDAEWGLIKKHFKRVVPRDPEKVKEEISEVEKGTHILICLLKNCVTSKCNLINMLSCLSNGKKLQKNPLLALHDAKVVEMNDEKGEINITMCRVYDIGFMKTTAMKDYVKIAFRKKLYLKKEYQEINIEFLQKVLSNLKENKLTPIEGKGQPAFDAGKSRDIPKDLYFEKIKKAHKKYYSSTRIIHSSKLYFKKDSQSSCCGGGGKNNVTKNALIIHIHGGGFVGQSTTSHERFLRKWTNELGIPVIGLNYSLSPEAQYPKGLDDIWQAYNWIVDHCKEELEINPEKIIVSGDSAGGNLVLALVFLCIATGRRVPDLCLSEYPCSDTGLYSMTPSLLVCFEDFLLNMKFLMICNEAYRGNYATEDDPFLNPEYCPDIILEKMPRTVFYLGSSDPLRDSTIHLIHKMAKLNLDFTAYEFENYIHGFYTLGSDYLMEDPNILVYKEIREFLDKK